MASSTMDTSHVGFRLNTPPSGFNPRRDLAPGLFEFLQPLHKRFTPGQHELVAKRQRALKASLAGSKPNHLPPSNATTSEWSITVPDWYVDQHNQMTGPADEAELVVKDAELGRARSHARPRRFDCERVEPSNILKALRGDLSYYDQKRQKQVSINPSPTVIWNRVRGLHLSQGGIFDEVMSGSLFDVASLCFRVKPDELNHPLCIYIPKA